MFFVPFKPINQHEIFVSISIECFHLEVVAMFKFFAITVKREF